MRIHQFFLTSKTTFSTRSKFSSTSTFPSSNFTTDCVNEWISLQSTRSRLDSPSPSSCSSSFFDMALRNSSAFAGTRRGLMLKRENQLVFLIENPRCSTSFDILLDMIRIQGQHGESSCCFIDECCIFSILNKPFDHINHTPNNIGTYICLTNDRMAHQTSPLIPSYPPEVPLDPLDSVDAPLGPINIPLDLLGPFISPVLPYKSSENLSNIAVDSIGPPRHAPWPLGSPRRLSWTPDQAI